MEKEQSNTPAKPDDKPNDTTLEKSTEPYTFYRRLTAGEEAMIEQHLREHPALTREEVQMEIECAGS
jgi:hypothetical protein